MCGIIGYSGTGEVREHLLGGLSRLEYRGYDSAGIALVSTAAMRVLKKQGRVTSLAAAAIQDSSAKDVVCGIGHTRWATHGEPSDTNAHPHCDTDFTVAVVHNGVIDNYAEIRDELEREGVSFRSETDSECLAHMMASYLKKGETLSGALASAAERVIGTLGVAAVSPLFPGEIAVLRQGSPIVVGLGMHGTSVASDVAALEGLADRVVHLEDGDLASIRQEGYSVFSLSSKDVRFLDEEQVEWDAVGLSLGSHAHYMDKEIHEQPAALKRAVAGRAAPGMTDVRLGGFSMSREGVRGLSRVAVIGCGSAYYAAMYGAGVIERMSGIPSFPETAGEFISRSPVVDKSALYVFVSQSGETADTIEALRIVKDAGGTTFAVVNVVGSSMSRMSDGVYIHAGPEFSVASTKAYTSMQACLLLLAIKLGNATGLLDNPEETIRHVYDLPSLVSDTLSSIDIESVSEFISRYGSMYYIGDGLHLSTAHEAAQKMKEVSYIHAEAYPSSELKHGPLALVTANFPSLVMLSSGDHSSRSYAAAQQIAARSGPVISICERGNFHAAKVSRFSVYVPPSPWYISPILYTIPAQVIAYRTSVALGRDIDKPRNLAKSVTVR